MKSLSIIIPVYQVEKYIRACLESVFSQNIDENIFEVIIVNDGTKDNSMLVIEDIITNHKNIIVINQENQGVSIARNNGFAHADGEYILFVDPDDLLVKNSLSVLLDIANRTKADFVIADYQRMNDEEIDLHQGYLSTEDSSETIEETGWESYLNELSPYECFVWRLLFKKDFLYRNNIRFTPGIFYEDIPFVHESYLKAHKCIRTHKIFYIYRIGNVSVTHRIDKRTGIDFGTAIAKTWNFTQMDGLPDNIRQRIKDNMFVSLSTLLYAIAHEVPSASDRKQIMKHLISTEPNLSFTNGAKQRFVNLMYKTIPYLYLEIRVIIAKFIERKFQY